MNFDKIKQKISIVSYLKSIGCRPQFENEHTARFAAPYRADSNPSLSVSKVNNLFFDHGIGRGGNILQLVSLVNENCDVYESAKILSEHKYSFSFHCKPSISNIPKSINIISTLPIFNKYLIQYLHSRKIPIELASQYCKEIHYENRGRKYYAIGFSNNSGGYELRSKFFKGCTNKDITILKYENLQNQCLVFEGFFDFLSYLVMQDIKKIKTNSVILNSVVNLNKALPFLEKHDSIITYLDNDEAGRNATLIIQEKCKNVTDKSSSYIGCNDLNDHLISK